MARLGRGGRRAGTFRQGRRPGGASGSSTRTARRAARRSTTWPTRVAKYTRTTRPQSPASTRTSSRRSPWNTPRRSPQASAWARACSACGTPIRPSAPWPRWLPWRGYIGRRRRRRVACRRHGLLPLHPRRHHPRVQLRGLGEHGLRTRRTRSKAPPSTSSSSPSSPIRWTSCGSRTRTRDHEPGRLPHRERGAALRLNHRGRWTPTGRGRRSTPTTCFPPALLGVVGLPRPLAWVFFGSPAVTPAGESKSDVEIMSLLAKQVGAGGILEQDRRGWGAQLRERRASRLGRLRLRPGRGRRHLGAQGRHLRLPDRLADGVFPTPSTKFQLYNDDLVPFQEAVPCYKPMLEDPKGELGQKYRWCSCSTTTA